MKVIIQYSPQSIEDFKAAIEVLKESGLRTEVSMPRAVTPAGVPTEKDGPMVASWKAATGSRRFYPSDEERKSGLDREEIAKNRLRDLGHMEDEIVETKPDEDFDIFGPEIKEES